MQESRRTCDFCKQPAKYDGKTKLGPWAYMCEEHFKQLGYNVPGLYTVLDKQACSMKVCAHCGEEKPVTEFYKYVDARGVERYRNECRACNLAERKAATMRRARRKDNG